MLCDRSFRSKTRQIYLIKALQTYEIAQQRLDNSQKNSRYQHNKRKCRLHTQTASRRALRELEGEYFIHVASL